MFKGLSGQCKDVSFGFKDRGIMNPFDILVIPRDADDATIATAYETLIRRHPTTKYPEKYRQIREAYKKLRAKKGREAIFPLLASGMRT